MLAAGTDGGRHHLRVGRGQHEHHVVGRLLQRLEQRRRRLLGELVDLVDDVDLPGPTGGAVRHPLEQAPHLADAPVRGGIQLEDVDRRAARDLRTRGAGVAGLAVFTPGGAVERLGQQPGRRRLAGAALPGEQIGVPDPAFSDGVAQCGAQRLLADQLSKGLGSVFPVQRHVGHRPSPTPLPVESDRAPSVDPAIPDTCTAAGSDQATPRHTELPAESCFLPDLTRFTGSRCAGPGHRRHVRAVLLGLT